jgi:hypothetical protein
MTETTKQRTERLLSMSSAELIMHVQDLTLENERYREALREVGLGDYGIITMGVIARNALEKVK